MSTVIIQDEQWFKNASFKDIKMLGIRELGIPADRLTPSPGRSEQFLRSLVCQAYVRKNDYGQVVKIQEISNPFGQPKRKRSRTVSVYAGPYVYVKTGLRAPKDDIRWEMMSVLQEKSTFEEAQAEFDRRYGVNTKFKGTGKSTFDFIEFIGWSLKLGWIERENHESRTVVERT